MFVISLFSIVLSPLYDSSCFGQSNLTAICSKSQYRILQYCKLCLGVVAILYKRIRELREDHDKTQKEMALILHCSQQVYSNYELGQRDVPTDILIKLARFYKVSTDYILGLSDKK